MPELTSEQIKKWLRFEEDEYHVDAFKKKHDIAPDCPVLWTTFSRLVDEGYHKRQKRGWYRKIKQVEPIRWWEAKTKNPLLFKFPRGIQDDSGFGFDDCIEVFEGDSIVLSGVSNQGKTAFALNVLADNINLFKGATMMVNEYKPVRFKNRMDRFYWADIWDGDKPKFELLPVTENHEDQIRPDSLNIIDWILLRGEFWLIAGMIEDMQMKLREGIVLVVLQKTRGKDYGMGGEWGQFLPSAYFILDPPGKLTVQKIKSCKEGRRSPEGKMFAYDIIEGGTQFYNIREVRNCPKCKGFYGNTYCQSCKGKGYIESEES